MYTKNQNASGFSVKAYRGDAKTLLAFNLPPAATKNLAGFTIACTTDGVPTYYLLNQLQFADPSKHAQIKGEPSYSSANAPFQKFYWVHVPGNFHQTNQVHYGNYTYLVTPRYFNDKGSLLALNSSLSVSVTLNVSPFSDGAVSLGFTRGFVQSQAFVHHFGNKAPFKPSGNTLLFNTKAVAGKNDAGQSYTFEQEYSWSGFTARERIFDVLNGVLNDSSQTINVFAYDLNEPDVLQILLSLAKQGRIRIILDNATLHHSSSGTLPEDEFEQAFKKAAKGKAAIKRGKFGRFAHDKIFIVYKNQVPSVILTGSTNFSVTGMYVNSNHVMVFNDLSVAKTYAAVFEESWNDNVSMAFSHSSYAAKKFSFNGNHLPAIDISFSPHEAQFALSNLQDLANRISSEKNSVLFAVMALVPGTGPVLQALENIHTHQQVFSYGISDSPGSGIALYKPGQPNGILVNAKPGQTKLPPPFDQEETVGLGHQIHHKFVICDFNGNNAVVYCGSSNLALGGESENGDNLVAIHDQDIATVFAIEAFALVDHFNFRDKYGAAHNPQITGKGNSNNSKTKAKATTSKSKTTAAIAGTTHAMELVVNDQWAKAYYTDSDMHCAERKLLA